MEGQSPLYAPWRMEYIRGLDAKDRVCFLCSAAAAEGENRRRDLVLWKSPLTLVMLNKYPYTNGHLLIAPRAHKAELEELTDPEQTDLQIQTTNAVAVLKKALSPQGFNLGMNLGRVAGAGLPGHVHQHVIPRWGGDTNFMSIVGQVRVIPAVLEQLYDELLRAAAALERTRPFVAI